MKREAAPVEEPKASSAPAGLGSLGSIARLSLSLHRRPARTGQQRQLDPRATGSGSEKPPGAGDKDLAEGHTDDASGRVRPAEAAERAEKPGKAGAV